ncbi:MAG TPA: hypothetical protein PLS66_04780 [Tepiditoga sp.]|nr:hypothetical protein [Tepiditoga sp.]
MKKLYLVFFLLLSVTIYFSYDFATFNNEIKEKTEEYFMQKYSGLEKMSEVPDGAISEKLNFFNNTVNIKRYCLDSKINSDFPMDLYLAISNYIDDAMELTYIYSDTKTKEGINENDEKTVIINIGLSEKYLEDNYYKKIIAYNATKILKKYDFDTIVFIFERSYFEQIMSFSEKKENTFYILSVCLKDLKKVYFNEENWYDKTTFYYYDKNAVNILNIKRLIEFFIKNNGEYNITERNFMEFSEIINNDLGMTETALIICINYLDFVLNFDSEGKKEFYMNISKYFENIGCHEFSEKCRDVSELIK